MASLVELDEVEPVNKAVVVVAVLPLVEQQRKVAEVPVQDAMFEWLQTD